VKHRFPRLNSGRRRKPAGAALLLVLWALMVLTFVVVALAKRIAGDLEMQTAENLALDARSMAYSGLQVALHPAASYKTPALEQDFGDQLGFTAHIKGEGGRINLNWILAGEDPTKLQTLKNYLAAKGLDLAEREAFVDSVLDWIDPDDVRRLNGNETPIRGPIANQPLRDLSELYQIPACDPLTAQSGWEKDFTLLSQGPIDVQWASVDVLGAIPGVGQRRAEALLQFRSGPDGEDGTADDVKLTDMTQVQQLLGLSQTAFAALNGLLSLNDPTIHITSDGRAGAVVRRIDVVAIKGGNQPQIIQWKED
jgi:type II secretory pathway component PulK